MGVKGFVFRLRKLPLFLILKRMSTDDLQITIREAKPTDAGRIAELGQEVFLQSYQHPYDPADMDAYLKEKLGIQSIAEDLQTETVYYYVAETDRIVGFVKFHTYMWTPRFKGKITFEVERLYIQKDMEGKSIGSRLMSKAIAVGHEKQYTIIWLSVWENNTKAISFHKQHGFEIIGDGIFTLGETECKYLIMRLS